MNSFLFNEFERALAAYKKFISARPVAERFAAIRYQLSVIGVRYVIYNLLRVAGARCFTSSIFFGKKFEAGLVDYGEAMCYYGVMEHDSEAKLTRFLIRNLKDGDNFLDVGASFGFYSMIAAVLAALKRNTSGYKNIEIFPQAVSDSTGTAEFFKAPLPCSCLSTLEADVSCAGIYGGLAFSREMVTSITLDEACAGGDFQPDIIKIDVEGGERKVIAGAAGLLSRCSPVVIIEIWRHHPLKQHAQAVDALKELGYLPYRLTHTGDAVLLEDITPMETVSTGWDNFIFKKRTASQ